jgi:hypothetical protein
MYIITVKGKEVSRHEKEQDARSEWHRLRPKYGMDVKVRKESKSPYMSQASKMDRYKASKDYLKIKTQQSRLPSIDKARYHQRKGLEGPFMTKSGQVIYYDKKFGKYYNSDTDMYIDHDDWKKMSEEAPANATGTSVAGTGDDSSTVVVKKKKKLQDKLMRRLKIKEALDRAVPDLEYPKDEITERKQQLIDMAKKHGENI